MKQSAEIVGLPLISILSGCEVGSVRDLIINPDQGAVEYLLITRGPWYSSPQVLPFSAVLGVGEDAVTTESEASLTALEQSAEARKLLERGVKVIGTRVMTRKGKFIGQVEEILIDEESGQIAGCLLASRGEGEAPLLIPSDKVLTFGPQVLVVAETAGGGEPSPGLPPKQAEKSSDDRPQAAVNQAAYENGGSLQVFEERQKRFLLGKRVGRTIVADSGEVIAREGETVTEEMLEKAKQAGKYLELTVAVER